MSQGEIAEWFDVDVTTVSRWERGLATPSARSKRKIDQIIMDRHINALATSVEKMRSHASLVEVSPNFELVTMSQGLLGLPHWSDFQLSESQGDNYERILEDHGASMPYTDLILQHIKNGATLMELVDPTQPLEVFRRHITIRTIHASGEGSFLLSDITQAQCTDPPGLRVLMWV